MMTTLPEARPRTEPRRRFSDLLLTLGRPLLRISLFLYLREVREGVSPRDVPVRTVDGPRILNTLFFGDVSVSGYGVLSYGLTVEARTADFLAAGTGRGVHWDFVAAPDLTMAHVASRDSLDASGVDVAFLLMGIPDVLLITDADAYAADAARVVTTLTCEAGDDVIVVVAEIPPMSSFRPIPAPLRRLIDRQVDRLNAVGRELAANDPHVVFLPFPLERLGEMYIQQQFSWRTMHSLWARALADGALLHLV